MIDSSNILFRLASYSNKIPEKSALVRLDKNLNILEKLSFKELWTCSKSTAYHLKKHKNKHVILIYNNTLEFLVAFLGCLLAKLVPIPVKLPNTITLKSDINVLQNILEHSKCNIVLIDNDAQNIIDQEKDFDFIRENKIINTNKLPRSNLNFDASAISSKNLCYIQYTSGSTAISKGVMISHENITQTLYDNSSVWQYNEEAITLNWVLHTHAYGLICGLLTPIYNGSTVYVMHPNDIITNPIHWLNAISLYQVTHSGGPNFIYELCANGFLSDNIALNLSSWKVAVSAGEVVLAKTMHKFINKFKVYGFDSKSFCPAYGLTEFTGSISSKRPNTTLLALDQNRKIINFDNYIQKPTMRYNLVISNGTAVPHADIIIVNTDTLKPITDGEEGEIWVTGNAMSRGYFRQKTGSKLSTRAKLVTKNLRDYLRTGDLGIKKADNIFITGRIKELIIIYGKKYNPLDIELIALDTTGVFNLTNVCFSISSHKKEKVILIQEYLENTKSKKELKLICMKICQKVLQKLGLVINEIIFIKTDSIPKTSSGKIQRKLYLNHYLSNQLLVIYSYINNVSLNFDVLLRTLLHKITNLDIGKIKKNTSLIKYGLDSITSVQIKEQIEKKFNVSLPLTTILSDITIKELSIIIQSELKKYNME